MEEVTRYLIGLALCAFVMLGFYLVFRIIDAVLNLLSGGEK